MSQINKHSKETPNITASHYYLIKRILKEIEYSIKEERRMMYSDIINLNIRKNSTAKIYNDFKLYGNYKIKVGKYLLSIDQNK